jgi:hypothetical protein
MNHDILTSKSIFSGESSSVFWPIPQAQILQFGAPGSQQYYFKEPSRFPFKSSQLFGNKIEPFGKAQNLFSNSNISAN